MRGTFTQLEEKATRINQDFLARRAEDSKQAKLVQFLKTKLGSKSAALSKLDT